ncbi:MAG TPA: type I glutamate--ammonia ligase [Firmicutes bacterium]|nr:type I glutamate--ammonia ligase [Bacillota bacterium]
MARSPQEVLAWAKAQQVRMVDLKFTDLPGTWQHFTIPVEELTAEAFVEGLGFDGSSIRGFKAINESDMVLIPDADTAVLDPFTEVPTLSLICDVSDPLDGEVYSRDPRAVAKRAEAYLKSTGIADTSYWGPEAEFFILDNVRFDQNQHYGYYYIDSDEGIWNSGKDVPNNRGYRPRNKEGYFPVAPVDTLQDVRTAMVTKMMEAGIQVECHHHEVATAGQAEIDMKFTTLTKMADQLQLFKYIVKNTACRYGKTATFMPKPLYGDNGSGMHVHQSLWKGETPLFADGSGYAGLSQLALWYIGGLLKHAPALAGLCSPTTNSFKRLVPGFEAPVNLVYSRRNRSAAVRIPMYSKSPKAKRIEFRPPDPSANPYLAFAALLMAGLDGIQNRIDPGPPTDTNLYELGPEAKIPSLPGTLEGALDALEADKDFLLKGGVFTEDLLQTWIDYKRTKEVEAVRMRPHPYEFALYYDI